MESSRIRHALYETSGGPLSWEDLFELADATPDILLASQLARPAPELWGERKLLYFLMKGAIADLLGTRRSLRLRAVNAKHREASRTWATHPAREWQRQAMAWFANPNEGQVTLNMVCDAFGWEVEVWRAWAARVVKAMDERGAPSASPDEPVTLDLNRMKTFLRALDHQRHVTVAG